MPDEWNGDLVIYNHGFRLNDLEPQPPELGPLAARAGPTPGLRLTEKRGVVTPGLSRPLDLFAVEKA